MKKVVKYCVYQDILLMGSINVTKYVYHMPWVEWSPWQSCRPCCTRTLFQASGTCSARAAHLGQNERFGFLGCVLLVLILIQQNGCFKQCLNACFDAQSFSVRGLRFVLCFVLRSLVLLTDVFPRWSCRTVLFWHRFVFTNKTLCFGPRLVFICFVFLNIKHVLKLKRTLLPAQRGGTRAAHVPHAERLAAIWQVLWFSGFSWKNIHFVT